MLKPGENSTAKSIKHLMPYRSREKIFKDKFYKLDFNKKCKTITSHMYYDCHMYIHPNQARGLTPREAARVQGFPDNYYFCGVQVVQTNWKFSITINIKYPSFNI